jgi:hypothetical protein
LFVLSRKGDSYPKKSRVDQAYQDDRQPLLVLVYPERKRSNTCYSGGRVLLERKRSNSCNSGGRAVSLDRARSNCCYSRITAVPLVITREEEKQLFLLTRKSGILFYSREKE